MQCRGFNCNPTFARNDTIDIDLVRAPHVVVCFDPSVLPVGEGRSAVQKNGAGLAAAVTPARDDADPVRHSRLRCLRKFYSRLAL
jgi:hypothetical protein